MNQIQNLKEKWNDAVRKAQPGLAKAGKVCKKSGDIISLIFIWIYRLRAVIMAIPVVWASVKLARVNWELLPETVGLSLQANGEYAYLVTREVAVYAPLAITALCLLMMLISRKTVYPWVISIFSLALPLLILLTNIFPA